MKYGAKVKHTAIRPPGGQRFFRLDTLKGAYTEVAIRERLAEARSEENEPLTIPPPPKKRHYTIRQGNIHQKPRKLRGFRALYVYYLYFLGVRSTGHNRRPPPFTIRKEVAKLERYQRQFRFLQEYRIESDWQLATLDEAIQARIDALVEERRGLYREKRAGWDVEGEIGQINQELRQLRRKLKTCDQITADIPQVREQAQQCRNWQREEMNHHRKAQAPTNQSRFERQSGPVR